MKNYIAYLRVSTTRQEEKGISLPRQEKLVREYAEKKGFQLVKLSHQLSVSSSVSIIENSSSLKNPTEVAVELSTI